MREGSLTMGLPMLFKVFDVRYELKEGGIYGTIIKEIIKVIAKRERLDWYIYTTCTIHLSRRRVSQRFN